MILSNISNLEGSGFLWCNTVLLGERCLTFWRLPSAWKCWKPLTQWRCITSLKIWVPKRTAVRTSNHASVILQDLMSQQCHWRFKSVSLILIPSTECYTQKHSEWAASSVGHYIIFWGHHFCGMLHDVGGWLTIYPSHLLKLWCWDWLFVLKLQLPTTNLCCVIARRTKAWITPKCEPETSHGHPLLEQHMFMDILVLSVNSNSCMNSHITA